MIFSITFWENDHKPSNQSIIGQLITAFGAYFKSFKLMEFSRFVFGIGGESLAVAQNTYASVWFKGDILNMVFGLQTSIARVGSTVNFQVVGPLFRKMKEIYPESYTALGWTLLIAGSTTLLSLIGAILLGLLDKRRERLTNRQFEENPKVSSVNLVPPSTNWIIHLQC